MNLHGLVAPYIGAINPLLPVTVQISTGPGATAADGTQQPTFATPGAITASIAAATGVLTVTEIATGTLQPGQEIAGAAVASSTEITSQLTGAPGGIGTYQLSQVQTAPVASEPMTTALNMMAQIQPMTWGDLHMVEGLNLSGTRRKIYLYGTVDGVERVTRKGGDLITVATGGTDDGVYLVAQVLEQFPDWVSCAATLQNAP